MPAPKVIRPSVKGDVLCSEGPFSVVAIREGEHVGKFAALWENHGGIHDTIDDLKAVLNVHEKLLLDMRIKK